MKIEYHSFETKRVIGLYSFKLCFFLLDTIEFGVSRNRREGGIVSSIYSLFDDFGNSAVEWSE